MAREIKVDQNYRDKLLKLIPSEIVAAYVVLAGVIPQHYAKWGLLIVSVILLVLVPFYLKLLQNVNRIVQIVITTISFAIWVYSLGGPFREWGIYYAWLSSVILILWTLIVPLFVKPQPQPSGPQT